MISAIEHASSGGIVVLMQEKSIREAKLIDVMNKMLPSAFHGSKSVDTADRYRIEMKLKLLPLTSENSLYRWACLDDESRWMEQCDAWTLS